LLQEGYARKTLSVYVSAADYLFDQLVVEGLLSIGYADGVRLHLANKEIYKKQSSRLPRFPKNGEAERMIDAVIGDNEPSPRQERNVALVFFLYSTGCRIDEAVKLNIGNLDMAERSAVVIGKGDKQRRVWYSADAADAINSYINAHGFHDSNIPLFLRHDRGAGRKAKRISTATGRNVVARIAILAGLEKSKFTPHYFRHNFAIKMLRATHDLALVQDLMGHVNPTSTRVYAKIYPEDLRDAHHEVFD